MGMLLLLAGGWAMQWSHQWGHMVSGCAHTAHHHHHGCEAAHDEAHTWNGPHEEEQWKAHLHVCQACDSNWTPEESFEPLSPPRLTNFIDGSFIKVDVGSCSKRCEGKFIGFGAATTRPRDTIREPL